LSKRLESSQSFEHALKIFQTCPASIEMKDRTFVFPIYSGLYFALKFYVDPSELEAYELDLVSNAVEQARLHGDPVHISRFLAMQADSYRRYGKYEVALLCHDKLKRIYNVKKHSALVIEYYRSDRSAQNFGNTAICLYCLGRHEESLDVTFHILDKMMPQMDLKNIHNSMIMIYPVLWILKHKKLYKKAAYSLEKYVFEPFQNYFGDTGKTFCLPIFKPLKMLFSILIFIEEDDEEEAKLDNISIPWALTDKDSLQSLITWVLDVEDSFMVDSSVDNSMANFARSGSSIGAEACLLLSKQVVDDKVMSKQLVRKGWDLAQISMEIANICGSHTTTYSETKPIYDELSSLMMIK